MRQKCKTILLKYWKHIIYNLLPVIRNWNVESAVQFKRFQPKTFILQWYNVIGLAYVIQLDLVERLSDVLYL